MPAAPVLRAVIDDYLKRCGIDTKPALEADNPAMAMSLIASTRSVALLPAYTQHFLPEHRRVYWAIVRQHLLHSDIILDRGLFAAEPMSIARH